MLIRGGAVRVGYRWLTSEGRPCSPWHRSPETAARWLARQAREPRIRPRPRLLVAEWTTRVTKRPRRRPLLAPERAQLIRGLPGYGQVPNSALSWLLKQSQRYEEERARRLAVRRITGRLDSLGGR